LTQPRESHDHPGPLVTAPGTCFNDTPANTPLFVASGNPHLDGTAAHPVTDDGLLAVALELAVAVGVGVTVADALGVGVAVAVGVAEVVGTGAVVAPSGTKATST